MKKNYFMMGTLAIFCIVIAGLNVKEALDSQRSMDLSTIALTVFGEDGATVEFPSDPFEGKGFGCYEKVTKNILVYDCQYLMTVGELDYYQVYQIPTTKISCLDVGQTTCTEGTYFGDRKDLGIKDENEAKPYLDNPGDLW